MSVRIDTRAFNDIRFVILGKRLGTSKFDARGRMEELWEICTQRETYFLTEESINAITECENFCELICDENIGLGTKTEQGIYIKGTDGRIEWIAKLRKNSRKGGRKTKAKWLSSKPAKQGPKEGHAPGPSSSVSSSSSFTVSSKKYSVGEKLSEGGEKTSPTRVSEFIGVYVKAFQVRFPKSRPDLGAKVQGQIKNFLKEQGDFQRACDLIQIFFQMEEKWFETKGYDFSTFLANVQKIGIAFDSGGVPGAQGSLAEWYQNKIKEKKPLGEISA